MKPALLVIFSWILNIVTNNLLNYPYLAWGLGIAILIYVAHLLWPKSMSWLRIPKFDFSRTATFESGGIEYHSDRFKIMQENEAIFFEEWGELPKRKPITKLFRDETLVKDLLNFEGKFFGNEARRNTPLNINWADERYVLFFQMLRNKYDITDEQIIAMLIYVAEERKFERYQKRFASLDEKKLPQFVSQVAMQDIHDGQKPNYGYLKRLVNSRSFEERADVTKLYRASKEEIKLLHFEKSLAGETAELADDIESQIKQEKKQSRINASLQQMLSFEADDYIIVGRDYSRDSRIDAYYRKNFSTVLSKAFDGHCCRCDEGMGQLEFDHFWWPKSQGGNFLMRSKNGSYVNNCIPLCRSCNSSKGARDFREFFSEQEVNRITEISQSINKYINRHMIDFEDADFPQRVF